MILIEHSFDLISATLVPFSVVPLKKEFESIWEVDMINNEVILGLDLLDQNMNDAVAYIETQKFNFTI